MEIGDRFFPQFPVQGVVGQPLGLLRHAVGRKLLDRLGDARVQITAPVVQQALVGHLVREGVLESVGELGKQAGLVEKLRRLQLRQAAEFLYEVRLFPDLEYTFKHALTHEVAYQGLLHDRRRTPHARNT